MAKAACVWRTRCGQRDRAAGVIGIRWTWRKRIEGGAIWSDKRGISGDRYDIGSVEEGASGELRACPHALSLFAPRSAAAA